MTKIPRRPTRAEPDSEKTAHERALDETIASTFPASDPLSTIPDPPPDPEHTGERMEDGLRLKRRRM